MAVQNDLELVADYLCVVVPSRNADRERLEVVEETVQVDRVLLWILAQTSIALGVRKTSRDSVKYWVDIVPLTSSERSV
ncbi:hypothetical protein JOH49_007254 [Bradyrhizobium elkanii]|uniref:Uncharacterized protein n=1 Tax=Bradyrhizobium elkanii TaxID=29448 RepID=A0A8I2C9J9_BRAEL|nr:hypothetical protein [Bradyrhizobium elkanii]